MTPDKFTFNRTCFVATLGSCIHGDDCKEKHDFEAWRKRERRTETKKRRFEEVEQSCKNSREWQTAKAIFIDRILHEFGEDGGLGSS